MLDRFYCNKLGHGILTVKTFWIWGCTLVIDSSWCIFLLKGRKLMGFVTERHKKTRIEYGKRNINMQNPEQPLTEGADNPPCLFTHPTDKPGSRRNVYQSMIRFPCGMSGVISWDSSQVFSWSSAWDWTGLRRVTSWTVSVGTQQATKVRALGGSWKSAHSHVLCVFRETIQSCSLWCSVEDNLGIWDPSPTANDIICISVQAQQEFGSYYQHYAKPIASVCWTSSGTYFVTGSILWTEFVESSRSQRESVWFVKMWNRWMRINGN